MASLGDFGDAARAGGPPKTILTPPPPPAPPPPATRRAQGGASPRAPPDAGFDRPPAPTRTPPSTRPPVGMSAPVVPQHRNDMLNKMLRGLEDDSLTVADVLGVLETELRSGAPTAAPLSQQFEKYLGPLTEFSGPAPGPAPGSKSGGMPKGAASMGVGSAPLMGPAPASLAVPALGSGPVGPPRGISPGPGAASRNGGQDQPQHVIVNCARCQVLDQQVKALAQSLSGLGARMFNWSLAHCRENTERNGLWHLVLKYLQPVSTVDARIAETMTGLQAAVGTSVADPTPGPPARNRRGGARTRGMAAGPTGTDDGGQVWQPPGGFDSTAAGGRAPRFAESVGHMAAAPESLAASREHSPMRKPLDNEARLKEPPPAPSPQRSQAPKAEKRSPFPDKKQAQVDDVGDTQEASNRVRRAMPDPEHMRAMPVLPYSPPPPAQPPIADSQAGELKAPNEVSVRFGASNLSKKLNGIYERVVGVKTNGKAVFSRGQKYLLFLADGTWAIKDGPEADADADVYAYVKDDAAEPYNIQRPWQVPADGDGFVADSKGAVTPGRSDHAEAAAAKAAKNEVKKVAMPNGGKNPGEKAMAAMDKREAVAAWEKEAKAKGAPRIRVTIVSASGLASGDVFGKSDPFVICKVPGKGIAQFQTPHMNNTDNPRWDHQEEVVGWEVGDDLQFMVYDKDTGSASDLLGVTELKCDEFWPNGIDVEKTLDGTRKGIISKLRVRVFVLERGKQGFVNARKKSPERSTVKQAKAPLPAPAAMLEAEDGSDIDEYEDWDGSLQEKEFFQKRAERKSRESPVKPQEAPAVSWQLEEDYADDDYVDITDEELEVYRVVFENIDKDGTGLIDLEELTNNLDVMGVQVTPKELRKLVNHVDRESNGIDFDEFLDLIQHFHDLEVLKLRKKFERFDKSGDGTVDIQELQVVFLEEGDGLSAQDVGRMMKSADVSGDGLMDFYEFIDLVKKLRQEATLKLRGAVQEIEFAPAASAGRKNNLAPSDRKRVKAYLKRKGFDSEDVNSQRKVGAGFTKKGFEYPLHTAALENLSDMVWLLLESKADPSMPNASGQTPMEIAQKADKKGSHKVVMQHLENFQIDSEAPLMMQHADSMEEF